ncbi:hypothetical protein HC891_14050 [Candidatus Gracilibacteria bacterium]|nr:hypothetical protein [Candidatus Gracilibacteria bacterium]
MDVETAHSLAPDPAHLLAQVPGLLCVHDDRHGRIVDTRGDLQAHLACPTVAGAGAGASIALPTFIALIHADDQARYVQFIAALLQGSPVTMGVSCPIGARLARGCLCGSMGKGSPRGRCPALDTSSGTGRRPIPPPSPIISKDCSATAPPSNRATTTTRSGDCYAARPSIHDDQRRAVRPGSYRQPRHALCGLARGTGSFWHQIGVEVGIAPAYAVAFFIVESSAGTNPRWDGMKVYDASTPRNSQTTHNIGNVSCAGYPTCMEALARLPRLGNR